MLHAIAVATLDGPLWGGCVQIFSVVIHRSLMSGFTFLRVDAYYQKIANEPIIVSAVAADIYRQKAHCGDECLRGD